MSLNRFWMVPFVLLTSIVAVADSTYADPEKTDMDFPFQGEYAGTIKTSDGEVKVGLQVIALGKGKFRAVGFEGGLPGDGWTRGGTMRSADGELKEGSIAFATEDVVVTVKNGVAKITSNNGQEHANLKKIERKSPTLDAKPPQGAIVLFDGKSVDAFDKGRMEDGLLMQGCTSNKTFGSHKVHIEFRTPYQPEARGQGRGNSGVYLQGRYEVQVLDSFGLEGKDNECGGIYSVSPPDVNMCLPPLTWQTYDIEYTAGEYAADGKIVKNPKATVTHNGVVIHKDRELPGERNTTSAPMKAGAEPGPLFLQDHGNPVRYRNIWVVETK